MLLALTCHQEIVATERKREKESRKFKFKFLFIYLFLALTCFPDEARRREFLCVAIYITFLAL